MSKYLTISHPLGTETPAPQSQMKKVTIVGNFASVKVTKTDTKVIETIEFNDDGQEAVLSTYTTSMVRPVEFTMHNVTFECPDYHLMNYAGSRRGEFEDSIIVRDFSPHGLPGPFCRMPINYDDLVWIITNPWDFAAKPLDAETARQAIAAAPKATVTFE